MSSAYIKQKIDCIINVSSIVTIHYFEFDRNFKSAGEKHDFWEIVYVDKGEAVITAKNHDVTLRQGEAYFHKPNEFHALGTNGKVAPNVFIITFVCNSSEMDFFKNDITIQSVCKLRHDLLRDEGLYLWKLDSQNPRKDYGCNGDHRQPEYFQNPFDDSNAFKMSNLQK